MRQVGPPVVPFPSRILIEEVSCLASPCSWPIACLAGGTLLGYAAASGKLAVLEKFTRAAPPAEKDEGACCSEGAGRSEFVSAQDDEKPKGGKKPNIVFIMGDDVGWFNIGAYHRGIMSGKTPNLDKLAAQGMLFTDYYAEASCTAGRANFITGEIPLRTGLTTVGQAGADVGMPAKACTIATALKAQGYATGQFGKNHLGDLNKFLPTVHGFDEFFGYLYHLDAMSDPYWYSFPEDPAFYDKYGPRNLVHCWATDKDDATVQPRWGKVGKQKIVDEGPLPPFTNMTERHRTWQDRPRRSQVRHGDVRRGARRALAWASWTRPRRTASRSSSGTTRRACTSAPSCAKKYQAKMNSKTNYGLEEAGMAQLDDSVGAIMKHLEDIGEADNTIARLQHRQRRRGVHLAGRRQ